MSNRARGRAAARVCLTRGYVCCPVRRRQPRESAVWSGVERCVGCLVLEKVRASYLSLRNNLADPLHQAPPAPVPCGRYTPRFLGTGFFRDLAVFILCCREREII